MKRISATQRELNIISKALSLGFEVEGNEQFDEVYIMASDFIIQNTPESEYIQEYCEVSRGRNQYVAWSDGKGFDYNCSGEICDWSIKSFVKGELLEDSYIKYPHELIIDSEGIVVQLYDSRPATEEEFESEKAY